MATFTMVEIVLRGSDDRGYELLDATTLVPVTGPIFEIREAIAVACANGAGRIWQQVIDERGRNLGDPIRLMTRRV